MPFKKLVIISARLSVLGTLLSVLGTLLSFPIFAQAPSPTSIPASNQYLKIQKAAKPGQTTLERWSEDSITASSMSLLRGIIGEVPEDFFTQLEQVRATGKGKLPKLAVGGALGNGTRMVAALFTTPASGIQYIASTWDNVLGKPAYAQGYGFKGLQFLLPLWKAFRNMVYVVSTLIFVAIGLMIILRVKVSPQAVVTIQSAIPAVITTLILVTFSYAIAGLMIDVGNIISGVVMSLIFNSQNVNINDNIINTGKWFSAASGFPIISDIFQMVQGWFDAWRKPFNLSRLVNPDMDTLKLLSFMVAPHWWSLLLLGGMVGSTITGIFLGSICNYGGGLIDTVCTYGGNIIGGALGGFLGAVLLPLVFGIIVGIWLIKLYFGLIKTYVNIIFKIITGPLEIAMGAFPNSKVGFSSWLLNLFANIMVFPIITIFLVILTVIEDAIMTGDTIWAPGLIWSTNTLYTPILAAAVGMTGLALLSKLPDLIPQHIFMIEPSPFGQAIGQNMGEIRNNALVKGVERGAKVYAGNEIGKGPAGRGWFGVIGGTIESVSSGAAAKAGETISKS